MEKPITMLIEEFRNKLVEVVNGSNLPPFLVKYEIDRVSDQIDSMTEKEALENKHIYEESCKCESEV